MFHPELGPLARLLIALTVFIPSIAAGYGTLAGLTEVDAPPIVAAFPAALITVAGILVITHGIETWLNQRAAARQEGAA